MGMALHASCAARAGDGVLILGPSGAGKSDLLLRLMGRGWSLVADDQVELSADAAGLLAAPPAALSGLLEVRGLGLLRGLPVAAPARLRLALELLPEGHAAPRLPEPARFEALGHALPRLALPGREASAPEKLEAALDVACGRIGMLAGAFAA
jgi:HPr kinase/phosphorylase